MSAVLDVQATDGTVTVLGIFLFWGTDEEPEKCLAGPVNLSREDLQDVAAEPWVLLRQLVEIVAGYSANLQISESAITFAVIE